jgi:hypothetical protein
MDGILALSREEAQQVDEWLYHGGLSQTRVTRHMIRVLADELEWQGRENSQSLRGLWYSGPKQVYQRFFAGKWNDDESYNKPATRRFSQTLSEVTSDMVKNGEVSYRDLNIVDDSRDRLVASDSDVESDKILFVEKEAKYRQLLPLAEIFELTLVSGGGWQATALIEDLRNILDDDTTYKIFVLTDYDPTGYSIARDFEERAETLGIPVDEVVRVGIEPGQVDAETIENEAFEVPVESDADQEWLDRHGLTDDAGRPRYGLELEAIGDRGSAAQDFRRVVADVLDPYLRKDRRRNRDLNIETANTVGRTVDDLVESMTENLRTALKRHAIGLLEDHEAVRALNYTENTDTVSAAVDLKTRENSDDNRIPSPLPWERYPQSAVDPSTNDDGGVLPPRPSRASQAAELRRQLREEMADDDGEVDVVELMGLK